MEVKRLMIYEWHKELGEIPRVRLLANGEIFNLTELSEGDLLRHNGKLEVIMESGISNVYFMKTIRRAKNGRDIEIVHRGQTDNSEGHITWTVQAMPDNVLDMMVHKALNGKGYPILNDVLRNYGL